MSRFEKGLLGALRRPINPAAILIMAAYTILWGFWIGNPFWDVFQSSQMFGLMKHFPEPFWGATAVTTGLIMLRGTMLRHVKALSFGAFIGFIHWSVIAALYFGGDWHNTGGITCTMVSIYCAYIYLNLRLNAESFEIDS